MLDLLEKLKTVEKENKPSRVTAILLEQGYSMDEIIRMKEEWVNSDGPQMIINRIDQALKNATK